MMYSYNAKNIGKDNIYVTRIRLIESLKFDVYKTSKRYIYYLNAWLGIIY